MKFEAQASSCEATPETIKRLYESPGAHFVRPCFASLFVKSLTRLTTRIQTVTNLSR